MSGPEIVQTKYDESNKFDLGPITDITEDPGSELLEWQKPPTFDAGSDALCRVVEEEDTKVFECLRNLQSEVRKFLATLLYAIDNLSAEITDVDVETVHEE